MEPDNPYIKAAVSKVSPSLVRLTSSIGDEFNIYKCHTNGTIFSCIPDGDNGPYVCYILTSVDLFNSINTLQHYQQGVSPIYKIDVCLPTEKLYEGEFMACDMEFNIAVIKIKSDDSLPTATLTPFSDVISLCPFGVSECHTPLNQSPYPTKVFPGDEVKVVCSLIEKPFDALVHSGIYSVDYLSADLYNKPFLRINCDTIISGAPVINCEGDVIGVAFNDRDCAAFLPVNLFIKWWKQVVTYGEIRRPWMGIQIINLYTADIGLLEAVVHDCDVSDGVFVESVSYRSPAESANMRSDDVICQCDGRPVRSFLEFSELLWDKSGEVIEAKGVRDGCHFVWKVEIKTIKTSLVPESLAKYKKTDSDAAEKLYERVIEGWKLSDYYAGMPRVEAFRLGILPLTLAKCVVKEAVKTEILQESLSENVVTRKKSTKRGNNKAKDKKIKKYKEVTGLKAKKRRRGGKNGADANLI